MRIGYLSGLGTSDLGFAARMIRDAISDAAAPGSSKDVRRFGERLARLQLPVPGRVGRCKRGLVLRAGTVPVGGVPPLRGRIAQDGHSVPIHMRFAL